MNINEELQQLKVIGYAIVPGYKESNEITQDSIKKSARDGLKLNGIFELTSLPFETVIEDKRDFLQNKRLSRTIDQSIYNHK
ncbi:hypothetical protein D8Z77_11985 [Brevibacillus laterosporus]|nr:hypothetical protein D8Z77_11985 [Brevibacillus laterosporus]